MAERLLQPSLSNPRTTILMTKKKQKSEKFTFVIERSISEPTKPKTMTKRSTLKTKFFAFCIQILIGMARRISDRSD